LIEIPAATTWSRAAIGGKPKLAIPSPEMSMIRRSAGSGTRSNAEAAASSAGPIAVSPLELRWVARTAAASAAASSAPATLCQPTVTSIRSGSDHSSTSTSMPPGMADIASRRRGFSKARAMPLRCSRYESAVTLADTSTASTKAAPAAAAGTDLSSQATSTTAQP
jgi:hypothetical protein